MMSDIIIIINTVKTWVKEFLTLVSCKSVTEFSFKHKVSFYTLINEIFTES